MSIRPQGILWQTSVSPTIPPPRVCSACFLSRKRLVVRRLEVAQVLVRQHSDETPSRAQFQQYLEQARKSIQRAIEALQLHRGRLSGVVASRAGELGTQLNQVSGYEEIDRLKAAVVENGKSKPPSRRHSTVLADVAVEKQLKTARDVARSLKIEYDKAVATRATAQKSVNSLLERKDRWSDSDVADFTSLIRSDHASNSAVAQTSAQLDAAEADVDRLFSELTQSILTRYHEEQVWSDKIRSFSTYANLIGLAINLIVFVGAIAFVEPWKRRKLAEGLESRMSDMMQKVQLQLSALTEEMGRSRPAIQQEASLPSEQQSEDRKSLSRGLVQANVETGLDPVTSIDASLRRPPNTDELPVQAPASRIQQYQQQLVRIFFEAGEAAQAQPAYLAGLAGLVAGAALTLTLR